VILVTRGKGFFVSPTDADIGDMRAHTVEIHPGVTKIVVMALGATRRWVLLGVGLPEKGEWLERREERGLILCL
jgi:hypothetical protein